MRKTFGKLLKEHERGLIYLTFLNDACDRVSNYGFNESDLEVLLSSVEYLNTDLAEHHTQEEKLYPLLSQHTGKEIIYEILNEHNLIMNLLPELNAFLCVLKKDPSEENSAAILKSKVNTVYKLLSTHIKKENTLLHNAAKLILNEKDFSHLYKIRRETV